jgi:hypothetical protein
MMALFDAASVLNLAILGNSAKNPDMVTLLSVVWNCFTSVIISSGIYNAFDRRLLYPPSAPVDPSEERKTIIIRDIKFSFVLGMLLGVCSAWVIMEILLGMDGYSKYNAGMLVGVLMLSFIFKTVIIWDIDCRFGLGMLLGVSSAWVVVTEISLGRDGHIKYSAGIPVGVVMLSLIFHFCSETNLLQFRPQPAIMDPSIRWRYGVDSV